MWHHNVPDLSGNRVCPYTGKTINLDALFDDNQVQIEHILPYSKTLDDSMSNKTLAMRNANKEKNNRSPFEAWGHDPVKYEAILERIQKLPYGIRKRFFPNAMAQYLEENSWVASQLNDTRYLSKLAKKYFEAILPSNKINVTKGAFTGKIRHTLGLNKILTQLNNLPEQETKNRDDHRHHAIDAIVIGLSTPKYLWKIRNNIETKRINKFELDEPWLNFRQSVTDKISKVIVDHKVDHSYKNCFFDATAYGRPKENDEFAQSHGYNLTERKDAALYMEGLTGKIEKQKEKIEKKANKKNKDIGSKTQDLLNVICDQHFRNMALKASPDLSTLKNAFESAKMQKIKLYKKDSSAIQVRHPLSNPLHEKWYISTGTCELQIWEDHHSKEWRCEAVNYYEANKYKGAKLDNYIKNREKERDKKIHPASKKVMVLHGGDTVFVEGRYWLIKTITPSEGNKHATLFPVNNQTLKPLYLKFNTFKEKKIRLANPSKEKILA